LNRELQAKGLLTEAQVIKYTELVDEFAREIPIVETTDRSIPVATSKSFQAIIKKFAGKAHVDAAGNLVNYGGAGLAFPDLDPKDSNAGIKAA